MSDCWLIASAALGFAVIGSLCRSRCPWSMDWTLSLPAEKSCRFNLHTLKVAFGRGKAIPHSLYAMSLSVAQVEGDLPGWLLVVPT